jgi:hypothetical protein
MVPSIRYINSSMLSIRLYHVPAYGKPVAIALAVTSKLPSTKTSLSVFAKSSICYFNGLRQGSTITVASLKRPGCFQANHLCPTV